MLYRVTGLQPPMPNAEKTTKVQQISTFHNKIIWSGVGKLLTLIEINVV